MHLPYFAPFPNATIRQNIPPEEWQLSLDSWASLATLYLRLADHEFSSSISENDTLTPFLLSFFHELAIGSDGIDPKIQLLRRQCFFLLHRLFSIDIMSDNLLHWSALGDFCHAFPRSEQFRVSLQNLWAQKAGAIEKSLQTAKTSLTKNLESKRPEEAETTLDRIAPLLRVSRDASIYMLTGSDFLDALYVAYPKVLPPMKRKLVIIAYLGLIAALEGPKPNYSLLSDHLYGLKSNEEQEQKQEPGRKTLVADLVTNTPFLEKVRNQDTTSEATRVKNTATLFNAFRQPNIARPKKLVRRKIDKEKNKIENEKVGVSYNEVFGDMHVHRMSMITQIQDLFPDLGAGFIVKLLDEYEENIEQVTAHLLDDSLPVYLAKSDHNEKLLPSKVFPQSHLPLRSSQLPDRHNVFDNDEFDKLTVDASQLHIGRRGKELTADKILSDRSNVPAKSSILSALAAFDYDDDERDDTYDAEDVGASVDTEADADLRDKSEEALLRAYTTTPKLFGRDAETRRGNARSSLKSETGMTDEAIEGWGIMIGRDPKRLRRLEVKFSAFAGQQRELAPSAWQSSPPGSGDEIREVSGDSGQRGASRGRGLGRGRGRGRGNGGNVSGPTGDKATLVARQRKDANKASRANHNRKDQRGKKMARGGFSG
ncbi:hypothetical protein GQ44DRAFT_772995 [Phaeosphaeriaceae sp. PMI808]|nr:hypothetical protein GQ44DRAFT_772995 [Phaeosphaeriaceae sp. PMI808]